MHQFLSYEILGILTVQTYLIVAFLDLAFCSALNRKNKPFGRLFGQACIWPIIFTFNAIILIFFVFCLIVAFALGKR